MRFLFAISFCFIIIFSYSQPPDMGTDLDGNNFYDKGAVSSYQTSDGSSIVARTSNSIDDDVTGNHGYYDIWIVKLNAGTYTIVLIQNTNRTTIKLVKK